jgi:hypothetical protein
VNLSEEDKVDQAISVPYLRPSSIGFSPAREASSIFHSGPERFKRPIPDDPVIETRGAFNG